MCLQYFYLKYKKAYGCETLPEKINHRHGLKNVLKFPSDTISFMGCTHKSCKTNYANVDTIYCKCMTDFNTKRIWFKYTAL